MQPRWLTLFGYFFSGAIGGIATCVFTPLIVLVFGERLLFCVLGGVFGFVIALYLWIFQGQRSLFRAVILVLLSAFAYFAALFVTAPVGHWSPIHVPFLQIDPRDASIMISGGLGGAFILFLSFYFLFAQIESWSRIVPKLLVALVASAGLALLGWSLWSSVGGGVWTLLWILHLVKSSQVTEGEAQFYSLYVVWQAGFALLLGILCPLRSQTNSSGSAEI
jgi:hypothetical protein